MKIYDLAEMPGTDPDVTGHHGMYSLSEDKAYWDKEFRQKAVCRKHGAMNCVSADRKIWRCIAAFPRCGEALYVEYPDA